MKSKSGLLLITTSLLLVTSCVGHKVETSVKSPFDDAKAFWNMSETNLGLTGQNAVSLQGNVRLGVELQNADKDASLKHGGNGLVADIEEGYLVLGENPRDTLTLTGDKMSLCIRFRLSDGKLNCPLFSMKEKDNVYNNLLYPVALNKNYISYPYLQRIKEGTGIEYLWRTSPLKDRVRPEFFESENYKWQSEWKKNNASAQTCKDLDDGILRLNLPLELIGEEDWHDLIIRFNHAHLEMFVDGVLIDEEWPHGNLFNFKSPFLLGAGMENNEILSGFNGQIDHLALWDRALTDQEIAVLCGGEEEIATRDAEILGEREEPGQYWRPHGYNTSIGDCMAFSHDGTFHVFFLSVRRYGDSKWGLLATPWGHITTKDFKHWEEQPCPLDITEPWECCLGTGKILHHNGQYYIFYIKHDRRTWFADNPNFGDAIFVAKSKDGIHYEKETTPVFVPGWFGINDINPDVYPDETNGGYILSLSNWKVLKSKDLEQWEVRDNITTPAWWVCTSYLNWNDWYYFSSCSYTWRSRKPVEDPEAVWDMAPVQGMADGIRVPQIASFNGRQILVGFAPVPEHGYYGSDLLIREVIQEEDGSLCSKFLEEMIPESGDPVEVKFKPIKETATQNENSIILNSTTEQAIAALEGVPQNTRITMTVKPSSDIVNYGIAVRGSGAFEEGCKINLNPKNRQIQLYPISTGTQKVWNGLGGVRDLDKEITLDIVIKGDLIDVCIDNRRTVITRNHTNLSGDKLFLFAGQGQVSFEDIVVRPLI